MSHHWQNEFTDNLCREFWRHGLACAQHDGLALGEQDFLFKLFVTFLESLDWSFCFHSCGHLQRLYAASTLDTCDCCCLRSCFLDDLRCTARIQCCLCVVNLADDRVQTQCGLVCACCLRLSRWLLGAFAQRVLLAAAASQTFKIQFRHIELGTRVQRQLQRRIQKGSWVRLLWRCRFATVDATYFGRVVIFLFIL